MYPTILISVDVISVIGKLKGQNFGFAPFLYALEIKIYENRKTNKIETTIEL